MAQVEILEMGTQKEEISATEAEAKLRAKGTLQACSIKGPLVLSGTYDGPSIKIIDCEISEIRADDCVFNQPFELKSRNISKASFNRTRFEQKVYWINVTITGLVSFEEAIFKSSAEFTDAFFKEVVAFHDAQFEGDCDMDEVGFKRAEFCHVVFKSRAKFMYSEFEELADFSGAKFEQGATFENAKFRRGADFSGATFTKKAAFEEARFDQNAYFNDVEFSDIADFDKVAFHQHADFRGTKFLGALEFRDAEISEGAHFNNSKIEKRCDFDKSTFGLFNCARSEISGFFNFFDVAVSQSVNFEKTVFNADAIFSKTTIEEEVDFSHARFEGTADFREINFVKGPICLNADFTKGADIKWEHLEDKQKNSLFKNYILLKNYSLLKNCVDQKHPEASEEYSKLKNIFEKNNDYESMDKAWEMFRHHASMADDKTILVHKWLSQLFVKWWTGYGTKPRNVFLTSLGVIVLFAYIYSFFGQQIVPKIVGWDAYLYFSLTTFIAAGVEGIHPNFEGWLKVLVVTEAFMGFFLMTLFIVMLARKLTR